MTIVTPKLQISDKGDALVHFITCEFQSMFQFINRYIKISRKLKIFQIPIQFNGSVAVHKLEWGLRVKTFAKATYVLRYSYQDSSLSVSYSYYYFQYSQELTYTTYDIHIRTVHCWYTSHYIKFMRYRY